MADDHKTDSGMIYGFRALPPGEQTGEFLPAERLHYAALMGGFPRSTLNMMTGFEAQGIGGGVEAWEQGMIADTVRQIRASITRRLDGFASLDAMCRKLCRCRARGRRLELRRHQLHPSRGRCPYVTQALHLASCLEALRRGLPLVLERGPTRERSRGRLQLWYELTAGVPEMLGVRHIVFRGGRWQTRIGKGTMG